MHIGPPRDPAPYPFATLDAAKARALGSGIDLVDFGMGDPLDETPEFIRRALAEGITAVSQYPKAAGLPELRGAISDWIQHRFNSTIDSRAIIPTLGAKEIIHSLPAYLADEKRDTVVIPAPAYPVYQRGASFHGCKAFELQLSPENDFHADLDAVPATVWERTAVLWLNYPHNPTGATTSLDYYAHAASLARQHGFVLASDEAYSEIYFEEPPVSVLQLPDLNNVVALNTLSKRSCMTGYRSGFVAGDAKIIEHMVKYRPSVGVTPQDFVQRASIAAWSDEDHVERLRNGWKAKRAVIRAAFESAGMTVHGNATFFLWVELPNRIESERFAAQLLENGVVVSPGSFFGASGEGFIRIALVPTLTACQATAEHLADILKTLPTSWRPTRDND